MNKVVRLLFVVSLLTLTACGSAASTPEAVAPTQAPTQTTVAVEPTPEPPQTPTNTPQPTAIPPTSTTVPTLEPTATASSTPEANLPYLGDFLWSADPAFNIATVEKIEQFSRELLASGLFFTLVEDDGPFTVLAPSYKFEDIAQGTFASGEQFLEALKAHIVIGMYLEVDLLAMDGQSVPTLVEGKSIAITVKDGVVYLNDLAMVTKADILARNGVIHVIDTFLLPPAE